jgi:hypothetical protein
MTRTVLTLAATGLIVGCLATSAMPAAAASAPVAPRVQSAQPATVQLSARHRRHHYRRHYRHHYGWRYPRYYYRPYYAYGPYPYYYGPRYYYRPAPFPFGFFPFY